MLECWLAVIERQCQKITLRVVGYMLGFGELTSPYILEKWGGFFITTKEVLGNCWSTYISNSVNFVRMGEYWVFVEHALWTPLQCQKPYSLIWCF